MKPIPRQPYGSSPLRANSHPSVLCDSQEAITMYKLHGTQGKGRSSNLQGVHSATDTLVPDSKAHTLYAFHSFESWSKA
jgi:hypothetical protein